MEFQGQDTQMDKVLGINSKVHEDTVKLRKEEVLPPPLHLLI
jgi:hypothetical protein